MVYDCYADCHNSIQFIKPYNLNIYLFYTQTPHLKQRNIKSATPQTCGHLTITAVAKCPLKPKSCLVTCDNKYIYTFNPSTYYQYKRNTQQNKHPVRHKRLTGCNLIFILYYTTNQKLLFQNLLNNSFRNLSYLFNFQFSYLILYPI